MQIGGALTSPLASAPYALPARTVSPDTTPDLARASQAPVTASSDAAGNRRSADDDDERQQAEDQQRIQELANRDRAVRAHEQAHGAAGGAYAGAPSYTFQRGPDGKRYAVGGEVSIQVGTSSDDPEATLQQMQVVQAAALAPADPSPQDLSVAARASAQAAQARSDLAKQRREEADATRHDASATQVAAYRQVADGGADSGSSLHLSA